MVVTAATGRHGRRDRLSLFCATVLLAGIAIAPTPTQSASSSSPVALPSSPFTLRRKVIRPLRDTQPAATHFFSLLSYGPMSVIAPTVYSDFRSPVGLSYQALSPSIGSGVRPMSETEGVDPAVTTMFDATLNVGLLPGASSAGANTEFGVGSNGAAIDSNAAVSTIPTISGAGGMPTISGAGGIPNISGIGGTQPVCSDDQLARGLEAGGKYWNVQGLRAKPEHFLPGMATSLGGLGRSGNQSNVAQPGPAGGWCRPAPEPFWRSSPLESRFLWIGAAALLVGVVVFWLSRGIKLPPARSGHFNHARVLPGDRP